jgi:hypothetical protein
MNKNMLKRLSLAALAACLGAPWAARAGVGSSVMQSAEVLSPGEFEFKAQADLVFHSRIEPGAGSSGFNLSPHLRAGLIEHLFDVDAFFGTGTTDFQIGALGKFNLLPDIPGQLGLAALGGISFLKDAVGTVSQSGMLATFGLVVSKAVPIDEGLITPYAGYQLEFLIKDGPNRYPSTLFVGTRWEPQATNPWGFYAEATIGLYHSIYGLSLGASQKF